MLQKESLGGWFKPVDSEHQAAWTKFSNVLITQSKHPPVNFNTYLDLLSLFPRKEGCWDCLEFPVEGEGLSSCRSPDSHGEGPSGSDKEEGDDESHLWLSECHDESNYILYIHSRIIRMPTVYQVLFQVLGIY